MKRVAVIGGGAAGLAAAIAAARAGAQVSVLEAAERVGRKILATGNGRCNFTNMRVCPAAYNNPDFVAPVLRACGPQDIRAFFEGIGLLSREEREGRVYPLSNAANSVLDVLRLECRRLGVELQCGFQAADAGERNGVITVTGAKGAPCRANAVVVATGGGTRLLEAFGHFSVPFEPVLCSLATDTDPIRGLSGVRVQARVSAYTPGRAAGPFAVEEGEVLFRDYGLSGIVVFDLSRMVHAGDVLSLDMLPHLELPAVRSWLEGRLEALSRGADAAVRYEDLLTGMFHPRVATCVLRHAQLRPSDEARADGVEAVARACKGLRTTVRGVGDAKHAQVTRGGASVAQFDPSTLESRKVEGVFAAGETLDVDARCGGYNLHWAWASGLAAGSNAARS